MVVVARGRAGIFPLSHSKPVSSPHTMNPKEDLQRAPVQMVTLATSVHIELVH